MTRQDLLETLGVDLEHLENHIEVLATLYQLPQAEQYMLKRNLDRIKGGLKTLKTGDENEQH